jgi:hypothetical protein
VGGAGVGCSDPPRPCLIDNALVGGPNLNQVVTYTVEAGLRGHFDIAKGSALIFMAPNPPAREAVKPTRPANPHSGPGQPGARQRARSAERPAIGPTCTRRLNLAAVLADVASFLELGRSGRTMVRPPRRWCRRASAARYGVTAKQAALKDQPITGKQGDC